MQCMNSAYLSNYAFSLLNIQHFLGARSITSMNVDHAFTDYNSNLVWRGWIYCPYQSHTHYVYEWRYFVVNINISVVFMRSNPFQKRSMSFCDRQDDTYRRMKILCFMSLFNFVNDDSYFVFKFLSKTILTDQV